ncbi:MAG TPA: Calx-beta domain-containing protein, partial [Pyrinomonadaceae bacterium]|nr:Calx-beta domain-containing protein [Pyrinomonadaceae bacterium]
AGAPLIEVDGLGLGNNAHGLVIKAGNTTIRGLAVVNFRDRNGIWLNNCDNNVIQGNYIGVAADGTTARQNGRGIVLTTSSNNVIGGTTAATRNVISGNASVGLEIAGNSNVVQGNFIGTNAAGTAALANFGGIAIFNTQSTNNIIGGTATGSGNLISGNQSLAISTAGPGTTIQGNLIGTDVTGTKKISNANGVQAIGTNMLIGGVTAGARNVISGNRTDGVHIRGAGSKLQGNYVGTDITGTLALGNEGNGVVAGETALIGGTTPEARNIIAGNSSFGNVALGQNNSGAAATVQGNYIGTDVTGTRALGGSAGIRILTNNHVIGGLVPGARNVISGNSVGIEISGFSGGPLGNVIQGNFIGLNAAGNAPVPNTLHGISMSSAVNNTIGGTQNEAANKIAYNGGAGVSLSNGTGNTIRRNSIFSNNGLGIDLAPTGVTANDSNDGDTGPNHLQNFPVISSVTSTASNTTIQGSLKSIPNTTFQIDFYSNSALDPSGHGEGAQFFNTTSVNTDGNGNATLNVTFPTGLAAGRVITATATDPNGNTSEFSAVNSTTTAGSLQFSFSAIRVIEDVGTITVTVVRTGGSTGSLSVQYATVDGTAVAGQDYTSNTGTLTFAAGETSKTLQLGILNDATQESNETFTFQLSNTGNPEAVGAPAAVVVTLQDSGTSPLLSFSNVSVVEGNAGTTTDAVFTLTLSAATGRTVSGTYTISNAGATGGTSCSNPGVDYITQSPGSFTLNPGTTTSTITVKVCGDTNAEGDESFRIFVSNLTGAFLSNFQAFGSIVNDDILELILEESGPVAGQAAALDAILGVRDPFRVTGIPDWFPTGVDKNTRVALIARNLQLNPGESSAFVTVRFSAAGGAVFDVPAEDVRPIPNTEFTQVIVRLPNDLPPGTCTVFIFAHSQLSNTGTIRIAP